MGQLKRLKPFWSGGFWDDILSPLCVFCGRDYSEKGGACIACWRKTSSHQFPQEKDGITSLFRYEGWFRDLILQLKVSRHYYLYRPLAQWIGDAIPKGIEVIVLAPPSQRRRRKEGVDPMVLIGRVLAGKGRYVVSPFYKVGKSQKVLSRQERRQRIQGSLVVKRGHNLLELAGKQVLILDDLVTTGSTLHEIERRLQAAGVRGTEKMVLGRAQLKSSSNG